ncbi:hypothetical protein Micbo1qcDRAFT_162743 [Microdochium bolleyi]|uniref:Uncharacterized protein n=1 Tax=Microdochium bolleyi TaxID=196109 RepID=A0A136J5J1_9PEZI|nr:hypothetical protein Micbo1qcDRAFT_162743 [Microdochium bolleyi]
MPRTPQNHNTDQILAAPKTQSTRSSQLAPLPSATGAHPLRTHCPPPSFDNSQQATQRPHLYLATTSLLSSCLQQATLLGPVTQPTGQDRHRRSLPRQSTSNRSLLQGPQQVGVVRDHPFDGRRLVTILDSPCQALSPSLALIYAAVMSSLLANARANSPEYDTKAALGLFEGRRTVFL